MGRGWLGGLVLLVAQPVQALRVVYPPPGHQTTAPRIFVIGTHDPREPVWVNGEPVKRSTAGHFAPSVPLALGDNRITVQAGSQTLALTVQRVAPVVQTTPLAPAVDVARLPGEPLCFQAVVSPPVAPLQVRLGAWQVELSPVPSSQPWDNAAVLLDGQPPGVAPALYRGCLRIDQPGTWGQPELVWGTQTWRSPGTVTILDPNRLDIAILQTEGIARTGPSTDHSRLTPLPAGTQDQITGWEGDWLRLRYGGWVQRRQVSIQPSTNLPQTPIRGVRTVIQPDWTDIYFPLATPIPIEIHQEPGALHLTLWHATAQTDFIRLDPSPAVRSFTWQQAAPTHIRYSFYLPTPQAWGYRVRYQDSVLILSIRHPPRLAAHSLQGIRILLDPGHGGPDDLGALGPDGTPEKQVNLQIALLLAEQLRRRGADVLLTRTQDIDVPLAERVRMIQELQPHLALSLHYNALPDAGDVWATQGIGAFWYHPQSQDMAIFLHNYLTQHARRPSYGVFWGNLALTRPTICPAVLLELGFMIHPQEFEWIVNPQAQRQLAQTLAQGIETWLRANTGAVATGPARP
ncbi:MAG: N-acetylmuramoyl-L-alanine amidase [Gloeomargarita sp. SKYBB_i_bin120]|nr:N-acetylmuramoyl-L-alanine amidase [Gloeomargarita sp. SKYB120]MDW8178334.1 N-acetylmuramoyl-L-alanine amidase [Gloeomargarita sp. SKYBB_i_bin120]